MSENGAISFEQEWKYFIPHRFPSNSKEIMQHLVIAPFWSDNDIRSEGAVRYAFYSKEGESALGAALLANLTTYIRSLNKDPDFEGRWMLVAHWDSVHPSPHGGESNSGISQAELDKVSRLFKIWLLSYYLHEIVIVRV